jgi:hypothetical protein
MERPWWWMSEYPYSKAEWARDPLEKEPFPDSSLSPILNIRYCWDGPFTLRDEAWVRDQIEDAVKDNTLRTCYRCTGLQVTVYGDSSNRRFRAYSHCESGAVNEDATMGEILPIIKYRTERN